MIERDDHGNPKLPATTNDLPPRDERDYVTSWELTSEAGLSYRQLDYWTRTNLLEPLTAALPGSGHFRVYGLDQVRRATVVRQLVDSGWSLQFCRAHIDHILEHSSVTVGPLTITIHTPSGDSAA